jgi:thymidine phosphorylase
MDSPLGAAVGNAVEVAEAVEVLAGGGPADVVALTLALAREMVALAGLSADPQQILASGRAMDAWRAMIAAQGAEPDFTLPTPRETELVTASSGGVVTSLDALSVGMAAWRLGAGRTRREDAVQPAAGLLCLAKPGDEIAAGTPLFELHTDTPERLPAAVAELNGAVGIAPIGTRVSRRPIVLDTIR